MRRILSSVVPVVLAASLLLSFVHLNVGVVAVPNPLTINVVERSGRELVDYSVMIRLTSNQFPLSSVDPSSIYFTLSDGTPLYYWVERYGATDAIIWVKLPKLDPYGYERILMHYGGENPHQNMRDPARVFLFFDDFTSSPLAHVRHYDVTGSAYVASGWLRVDSAGSGDFSGTSDGGSGVFIPVTWTDDYIVEVAFRQQTYPSSGGANRFLMLRRTLDSGSPFFGLTFDSDSSHVTTVWRTSSGSSVSWGGENTGCQRDTTRSTYYARIMRISSTYYAFFSNDGSNWCLAGSMSNIDPIGFIGLVDSQQSGYTEFDYLQVRRVVLESSVASVYFYYGNQQASSRSNGDDVFIFFDDFTTNPNTNGKWIVFRAAGDTSNEFVWDSANRRVFLTRAAGSRGSMAFFRNPKTGTYLALPDSFAVTFYGGAGGGTGADGFAFAFFKNHAPYEVARYTCIDGGDLDLSIATGCTPTFGYAIEFDNWANGGDPSSNHNALIVTNTHYPYTHLAHFNTVVGNEDNVVHKYEIYVDAKRMVQLYVDGSLHINYIGALDTTYRSGGVSGSTGGFTNNHWVERFIFVRPFVSPEPSVVSWGAEESEGDGWLPGWSFRKSFRVSNGYIAPVVDYPIRVVVRYGSGTDSGNTVYCNGKCKTDFSDIRFATPDGTELAYWIEEMVSGNYAVVWVKIPRIESSVVDYQPIVSFGFDSADELGRWLIYSNNYVLQNGVLRLNVGGFESLFPLPCSPAGGCAVEARVRFDQTESGAYSGCTPGAVSSSQFVGSANSYSDALVMVMRESGLTDVRVWIGDGSTNSYNVASAVSIGWSSANNVWYVAGIAYDGGVASVWLDYAQLYSASVFWYKDPAFLKIGHFFRGETANIQDTSYDWVRVRKYVSPEPLALVNANVPSGTIFLRIVEQSGTDLTDYAVRVRLTSSNVPGLLITYPVFTLEDDTPLYYFVERLDPSSGEAFFLVKVPSVPAYGSVRVIMNYGARDPRSAQFMNPGEVFSFFDDFSGQSLDSSKWVANRWTGTSSWSVSTRNGVLRIYSGSGTAAGVVSRASFQMPFEVNLAWRAAFVASGREQWIAVTHASGGSDSDWLRHGYIHNTYYYQKRVSGTITTYQSFSRNSPTRWTLGRLVVTPTQSLYFENFSQVNSVTTQDRYASGTPLFVELFTYSVGYLDVDWLGVRRVVIPEPAVTIRDPVPTSTTISFVSTTGTDYLDPVVEIRLTQQNFNGWDDLIPSSIYFVDRNNNPLPYRVYSVDLLRREATIYVRLPYLLGYSYFVVRMHYGGENPYRNLADPSLTPTVPQGSYQVQLGQDASVSGPVLSGWSLRYLVRVSGTGGSPVTGAVVEVSLSERFDFDVALPDGSDIRVTDASGNVLQHMLVGYDPEARTGRVRFIYPGTVPPTGYVEVFIFSGNYGAQRPQQPVLGTPSLTGTIVTKDVVGYAVYAHPVGPVVDGAQTTVRWRLVSEQWRLEQTEYRVSLLSSRSLDSVVWSTGWTVSGSTSTTITPSADYHGSSYVCVEARYAGGVSSSACKMIGTLYVDRGYAYPPASSFSWTREARYTVVNLDQARYGYPVKIPAETWMNPTATGVIGRLPTPVNLVGAYVGSLRLGASYVASGTSLAETGSAPQGRVELSGLPPSGYVEVYDRAGRLVYAGSADQSGRLSLLADQLPVPLDGGSSTFYVLAYQGSGEEAEVLLPFWIGYDEDSTRYLWVYLPVLRQGAVELRVVGGPSLPSRLYGISSVFPEGLVFGAIWSYNGNHPANAAGLDAIFVDASSYGLYGGYTGYQNSAYYSRIYRDNIGDQYASEYRAILIPLVSGTWSFATDSDDASHIVVVDATYGTSAVVASWYGGHSVSNSWNYRGNIYLEAGRPYVVIYRQEEVSGSDSCRMAFTPPGYTGFLVFSQSNLAPFGRLYAVPTYIRSPVVVPHGSRYDVFRAEPPPTGSPTTKIVVHSGDSVPLYDVLVTVEVDASSLGLQSLSESNIRVVGRAFSSSSVVGAARASLDPGRTYTYSQGALTPGAQSAPNTVRIAGLPPNAAVFFALSTGRLYLLGISDDSGVLVARLTKPVSGALVLVSGTTSASSLPFSLRYTVDRTYVLEFRALVLYPGVNEFDLYVGDFGSAGNYGFDHVYTPVVSPTKMESCLGIGDRSVLTIERMGLAISSANTEQWCRLNSPLPGIGTWMVVSEQMLAHSSVNSIYVSIFASVYGNGYGYGLRSLPSSFNTPLGVYYYNDINAFGGGTSVELYPFTGSFATMMRGEVLFNGTVARVRYYATNYQLYPTSEHTFNDTGSISVWFPVVHIYNGRVEYRFIAVARVGNSVRAAVLPLRSPAVSATIPTVVNPLYAEFTVFNPNRFPAVNSPVRLVLTPDNADLSRIRRDGGDIRVFAEVAPVLPGSTQFGYVAGSLEPDRRYTVANNVLVAKGSSTTRGVAEIELQPGAAVFLPFYGSLIPLGYDLDGDGVVEVRVVRSTAVLLLTATATRSEWVGIPYFVSHVRSDEVVVFARVPYVPPSGAVKVRVYYGNPNLEAYGPLHGVDKVFVTGDDFERYPNGPLYYLPGYRVLPTFTIGYGYISVGADGLGRYLELYAQRLTSGAVAQSEYTFAVLPVPLRDLSSFFDSAVAVGLVASDQNPSGRIGFAFSSRYPNDISRPTGLYGSIYASTLFGGTQSVLIGEVWSVQGTSASVVSSGYVAGAPPVVLAFATTQSSSRVTANGEVVIVAPQGALDCYGVALVSGTPTPWRVHWVGVAVVPGAELTTSGLDLSDRYVEADESGWSVARAVEVSNPSRSSLFDYQLEVDEDKLRLLVGARPSPRTIRFAAFYPVTDGEILAMITVSLSPGKRYYADLNTGSVVEEGASESPKVIEIRSNDQRGLVVFLLDGTTVVHEGRDYDGDGYVEVDTTAPFSGTLVVMRSERKYIYLPYYCLYYKERLRCWVKVPHIPPGTSTPFRILYSPTAPEPSPEYYAPRRVFALYEDFEVQPTGSWMVEGATYGLVARQPTQGPVGSYSLMIDDQSTAGGLMVFRRVSLRYPSVITVVYSMVPLDQQSRAPIYPVAVRGYATDGTLGTGYWGMVVLQTKNQNYNPVNVYMFGSNGYVYYVEGERFGYTFRFFGNRWYWQDVVWSPDSGRHLTFVEGVFVGENPSSFTNGKLASTVFAIGFGTGNEARGKLYVDLIFARKFSYPEPTVVVREALGAEVFYRISQTVAVAPYVVPIDISSPYSDTYYDVAIRVDAIPGSSGIQSVSDLLDPRRVRFFVDYVVPKEVAAVAALDLTTGATFSFSGSSLTWTGSSSSGLTVAGLTADHAVLVVIPGKYSVLAYDLDGDGVVTVPIHNYRVDMPRYTGLVAVVTVERGYVVLPFAVTSVVSSPTGDVQKVVLWVRVPYVLRNSITRVFLAYGADFGDPSEIYGMDKVFARNLVYLSTYSNPHSNHPTTLSEMNARFSSFRYSHLLGGGFAEQLVHPRNPFGPNDAYASYYVALLRPLATVGYYFATDSDDASDVAIVTDDWAQITYVTSYYGAHGPAMTWRTGNIQLRGGSVYALVYRQTEYTGHQTSALGLGAVDPNLIFEFAEPYWRSFTEVYSTPTFVEGLSVYVGGANVYGPIEAMWTQWVGTSVYHPFFWFRSSQSVLLRVNGIQLSFGAGENHIKLNPGSYRIEAYVDNAWVLLAVGTARVESCEPAFVVSEVYANGTYTGYLSICNVPYPVRAGQAKPDAVGVVPGTVVVETPTRVKISLDVDVVNVGLLLDTLIGARAEVVAPIVFQRVGGFLVLSVVSSTPFGGFVLDQASGRVSFMGVSEIRGFFNPVVVNMNPLLTVVEVRSNNRVRVFNLMDVWNPATLRIEVRLR